MHIAVIGTGYVGLVSGACFADFGFSVDCIDENPAIINVLSRGGQTFYEPGLADMLSRNIKAGRLGFTTDLPAALKNAGVIMLAVGTPSRSDSGEADMHYIDAAAEQIAANCRDGAVIITKSTVLVGTNAALKAKIAKLRPGLNFSIVSNPEFLREGQAIADFTKPDRVVIGLEAGDSRSRNVMEELYAPLQARNIPIIFTSLENAELIKYAANAFLALKLTFINQVADLCEKLGGNIDEVSAAVGLDKRIGSAFLRAGPGFGGSCFPKDTLAFAAAGQKAGAPQQLIENLIAINKERRSRMAARVIALMGQAGTKTAAILGCAFKANTDDMRESPAINMIAALQAEGFTIRLHDPEAMDTAKKLFPKITFCADAYEAAQGAGVCVIMTEWDIYRRLDFARLRQAMGGSNILVDMRNLYQPDEMAARGMRYYSIGRPAAGGKI